MRLRFSIILALCSAWATQALAVPSLVDLFHQTPAPPADGPAANSWLREGQIVAPELLNFEARLQEAKASPAKPPLSVPPTANDALLLQAVVRGYEAYRSQNSGDKDPAQVLAKRTAWIAKRFDGVRKRMGSQAVGDHNAVDDELKAWGGLFLDWQTSRSAIVEKAQVELAAVERLGTSLDDSQQQSITAYRLAMVREIELELSITRLAIERLARP